MAYTKYSLTPADNNAAPPNGAPEGMLPSAVNDTMRDMMAQIRDVGDGIRGGTYTMTAPVITGGSITGVALSGNTLTSPVITGGSINNTPIGASTANTGAFTSITDSGNLAFTGTGNRITGDMSNATLANRVAFQSSTTNGVSVLSLLPNGTSITSGIACFANSDPTNTSYALIADTGGQVSFRAAISGTGTYEPMTFFTNNTERLRIDTSGNVGIGTTSPASKLDVVGTITTDGLTSEAANGTITSKASSGFCSFTANTSASSDAYIFFQQAGTEFGRITAENGGALVFSNGSGATERMRIDSSGFVGINATPVTSGAVSGRLFVSTSANNGICSTATVAAGYRFVSNALSEGGTFYHLNIVENGTQRGSITSNGTVTVYATTSDYRLKENVKPMVGALAIVAQLKPVTYDWIENKASGQGFIAHELQAIIPDAVVGVKDAFDSEDNPKYQQIDTSVLVATLTAAIQELKAEFDAYKATHP